MGRINNIDKILLEVRKNPKICLWEEFKFPEPFDSGIRLKHVLESEVDEKHYLRQELQDRFKQRLKEKEFSNTVRASGHGSVDRHSWDLVGDNKILEVGSVSDYKVRGRVCSPEGVIPTILSTDYKGPKKIIEHNKLNVIGSLKGCAAPYDKMLESSCRVHDTEGVSPTVTTCEPKIFQKPRGKNKGGVHDISPTISSSSFEQNNLVVEPCGVASRGRYQKFGKTEQQYEFNKEGNAHAITTVNKDSMVVEPQVLRSVRTEYGKAIRKAYESGEIKESRHNMRELEPRTDGICGTLTSVLKDNLIYEPQV